MSPKKDSRIDKPTPEMGKKLDNFLIQGAQNLNT